MLHAFDVLEQYRKETGDETVTVVVSTASPFKFCSSVLDALGVKEHAAGTEILDQLSQLTGVEVPQPLARLKNKQPRFDTVTESVMLKFREFSMSSASKLKLIRNCCLVL